MVYCNGEWILISILSATVFSSLITHNLPFIARLVGTSSDSGGRPTKKGVPQVVLVDEKGEHRGAQGSYCWGEICIDYIQPSSRTDIREKLSIQKDGIIAFKVDGYANPEKFHVTIFSGENIVLHKAVETKMKIQVTKGIYFLNAKATWEGQGDVSNVFLIEVL